MPAGNGVDVEAERERAPLLQLSDPSLIALAVISIPRLFSVKNLCIVSILARCPGEVNYFWGCGNDLNAGRSERVTKGAVRGCFIRTVDR
jgi:hypothetical protein